LFETNTSTRIVSPAYNGFLVETSKGKIPDIIKRIKSANTDKIKVDVSRLKDKKGLTRMSFYGISKNPKFMVSLLKQENNSMYGRYHSTILKRAFLLQKN
jgi:hypothetical protein